MTEMTRRGLGRAAMAGAISTAAGAFPALAQGSNPIRIGYAMSLSGGLAANGRSSLLAHRIWAEDVNARGGLMGRPVQIVSYDDQSNPANVPSLYTKLIDVDKVDIVTSPYATAMIAPSMPVIMQRGMTYVSLFGAGVNEKLRYDRYFSMNVTGDDIKGTYARGFLECTKMLPTPPRTISILAVDNDFAQRAAESVRSMSREYGLRIVYDRSYPPTTVDFTPTIRAIQAARPDVVFFASYPPDSNGILRAVSELKLTAALFGGGMVGPQIAAVQAQLGPILNNLVNWDVYSPEPTMKFPGVEAFQEKYRARAPQEQTDVLGNYLQPYAYAQMQVVEQAVNRARSLDQAALAADMKANPFSTIVGDVKFGNLGEWATPRNLFVQFQNITDGDLEKYKRPGTKVILYPPELKSGTLRTPYGAPA
ncbi:amino acid ABC transporter substrate-binding protein [Paracraurococcus ruber]|uniref:Branched-chain amino acid ABC transporter substrate-binding protein n=1 Tax=Paracraurococcus ruber TaxID=77675 RepID=A0ABS1CU20_9PROT|nr:amino acid ABC transporter substrate-binding protein [Paracraurococcus ruber]MBK1657696.1 branched-chain amino acid ABC transporter substrate-binding protein [Paracraurococcus ruber]TDG31501.1 branched-chain amino acid ABC transporter substrate-binding protein [Paracraurococcus ruber]